MSSEYSVPSSPNSNDSSSSQIERLYQTRTELLSEKKIIKRDIQKSQLKIDGYQHDLMMAKEAYNLAESKILERTKKLAALFGHAFQNDDQLIEMIQSLIEEGNSKEKTVEELQNQLEEYKKSQNVSNSEEVSLQQELQKLQKAESIEISKLNQQKTELESINNSIFEAQKTKAQFFEMISPLSAELSFNPSFIDSQYIDQLSQRINSYKPETVLIFKRLSESANIPFDPDHFDPQNFLQQVEYVYKRLNKSIKEQKTLNDAIISRLEHVKKQISKEKKQRNQLLSEIQQAKHDLENTQLLHSKKEKDANEEIRLKIQNRKKREIDLFSIDLPKDKIYEDPNELLQIQINRLQEATQNLIKARSDAEIKKLQSAANLERGINIISNAADTISRANRRLLRNLK